MKYMTSQKFGHIFSFKRMSKCVQTFYLNCISENETQDKVNKDEDRITK